MDESVNNEAVEPEVVPVDNRKRAIAIFGVIMLIMVAIVAFAFSPKGDPVGGVLPGDPVGYELPDLTLDRLDGQGEVSLKDYVGQPMVINFWGAWCTTCELEAEILGNAEREWRDLGVVFIGIDSKDEKTAAQAFEDKYGMDYMSLVDPEGGIAADWGVTGFPETFFIGKDGRISAKYISAIDAETLNAYLSTIIE